MAFASQSGWNTLFVISVFIAVVAITTAIIFILLIAPIIAKCCTFKRSLQLACILLSEPNTKAMLMGILGGRTVSAM